MIALIQIRATNQILALAAEHSDFIQILSTDYTRLIAQIISGIGFLGAGAIIVTKRSVSGLATAASIWATAGIGKSNYPLLRQRSTRKDYPLL